MSLIESSSGTRRLCEERLCGLCTNRRYQARPGGRLVTACSQEHAESVLSKPHSPQRVRRDMRSEVYESLGMKRVRGAHGGVYWE